MPIQPSPVFEFSIIYDGIIQSLDDFLDAANHAIDQFLRAFPNPARMLDVVINFITLLPGFIVTIPISGIQRKYLKAIRDAKFANRLMTVEQAFNMAFEAHKEIVRNVTFTDNQGLIGLFASWFGRFLWRLGKRVKLVYALLKADTLEGIVKVVYDSLARKAGLLRIIAMVLAIVLVIEGVGFLLWSIGFGLLILEGDLQRRILPQDSRRVRKTVRNHQFRVNARTGSDV